MKNIILVSAVFVGFFVSILLSPQSLVVAQDDSPSEDVSTTETVSSFELFWPIVAGKVKGEGLYFLKSFKEKLRELIILSPYKKADYNITLSEKRLIEGEYLLVHKQDEKNAKISFDNAKKKREKALDFMEKAQSNGQVITDLKNAFTSSLEKQKSLLIYLSSTQTNYQSILQEDNAHVNFVLSQLESSQ